MPEALKNNNETAIRRKRIFQLFKKFHPDVMSGSGYENEAAELAKVLTAILDLEIDEVIPKEFRGKLVSVVFVDADGRSLRSKTPLQIADTQEEFLYDLEYIVINKKMPIKESASSKQASNTKTPSENSSREEGNLQDRMVKRIEIRVTQIHGPLGAAHLVKIIKGLEGSGELSSSQCLDLVKKVQVEMVQLSLREIKKIIGTQTATGMFKRLKEWGEDELLSRKDIIDLSIQIQNKFGQLIELEISDINGPLTTADMLKRIQNYVGKGLLTQSQAAELSRKTQDHLSRLKQSKY